MSTAHRVNIAPIFLRLVLGLTFLWAGLGKIVDKAEFPPDAAATLVQYNIIEPPADPDAPVEAARVHGITLLLINAAGGPATEHTPDPAPETQVEAAPAPETAETPDDTGFEDIEGVSVEIRPEPDASPEPPSANTPARTILPAQLSSSPWPQALAYAGAFAEILAGLAVLVGLLTRFAAFNLLGVIAFAAWLTQVGPAVMSGDANLGFLPAGNLWDPKTLSIFLWQVSIAAMCLVLMCTGSGALSVDRVLAASKARRRDRQDEEDEE